MTLTTPAYDWQQLEASADTPVMIEDNDTLARHCEHWQTLPMIAVDTEFQRVDTFYPIPGLIQIADDQRCYLIDPLAVTDFEPLKAVFVNEAVLKVLHAATEDLELFNKSLGVLPRPLHDTQVAAAFLDWGFSMGLQRLLEFALGVEMAKHETTSDWLRRPLTESQERYAALDVAYLPAICQRQRDSLSERGMLDWLSQESELMLQQAIDSDPMGLEYYKRFAQMWGLPEHKVAALRDLTAWREQTSRARDVPRNRVLRNQSLLEIVNRWPRTQAELARIGEIKRRIVRTDGPQILSFLENAQASAERHPPESILKPLPFVWNKHLKRLKAIVRAKAEALGIAPEILLRKKELDALVRSGLDGGEYRLPENISAWRRDAVGEQLLAALHEIEKQKS